MLPFDTATWISIGIIFLTAYVSIIIINLTNTQTLFQQYSHSISILDIFRNFFGIGQARVSDRNFGRLILISFTLWCLVIRTAYQSKLFDYTTTPIRKPEMKSLEDMRAKNITLFVPQESGVKEGMLKLIVNEIG